MKSLRLLLAVFGVAVGTLTAADPPKFNVLFIAVDDLKPIAGCYGDPIAKTPNLDRLAARGLLFNRAYCQQAVCSPSRSSLMTGCRPDRTKVFDLRTHFRKALPEVVTLTQQFKSHGYQCEGMGKIYHPGYDDPPSWSIPSWMPKPKRAATAGTSTDDAADLADETDEAEKPASNSQAETPPPNRRLPPKKKRGPAWADPDVADDALPDGQIASHAIERLRANRGQRFFLAVGFLKPHLPFIAPKKYWDVYDPAKFALPSDPHPPKGAPSFAATRWAELRTYEGIPRQGALTEEQARSMIHGYYAAMSYMDAQLGRVLEELERLGLRDNTIVILWGDHGWHLGDHGFWCKHTNYEQAVHAPLMISVPGQKSAGAKTDALVEFVDVYPTLCELCGIPKPDMLDGKSFAPLLDDPAREWKKVAFSQYPRSIPKHGRGMGRSMRTERYRLVEWSAVGDDIFRAYELYDDQTDPGETVNLANDETAGSLLKELAAQLEAAWPRTK